MFPLPLTDPASARRVAPTRASTGGSRQKTDRGTAPEYFSGKTQRDVTGLLWCVQYAAENWIWEPYWRHVEKDVNTDFSTYLHRFRAISFFARVL